MDNLGFLAALGAAVCWGSYMVPFKKSGSLNLIQFQAVMAVGIGLSGLFISVLFGYRLGFNAYGLFSGVLWVVANAVFLVAVANLGLAKAAPIASSLVIILSFLWGALIFHEIPSGIMVGFLGIGLIIVGVILIGIIGNAASRSVKKGLFSAVAAGTIWGSQLVPLKVGQVAIQDFFFPVCLGILVSGLIIFALSPSVILSTFASLSVNSAKNLFKSRLPRRSAPRNDRQVYAAVGLSLLSGLIWNIGNLLSIISISLIGLSRGLPITQSASLVAVLWGLFYFKEVTNKKARFQILIGAIILLVGVATLGLA